jgi:hypothetical protein
MGFSGDIEERQFKELFRFRILYDGWEMDNEGYVCEAEDGGKVLILTSHGNPYVAEADELDDFIATHQSALDGLRAAKETLLSVKE